ncbi:MAG: UDP-N-acetylmuramoylalanyl-D-glutamate--2,6-diaminopimelate ligase [Methanocella sp. PtaU1.Bin125]|nr:MAG: UDP-N-acetylmuramoylalanyl-D-glutamate--2,6-diaminopimelate ligase [Methanocella sp. PtaU1.Bin125]
MELRASRVAVADVNHGGLTLAKELISLGYDAFAVDVYGTRELRDAAVEVVGPEDAGRYDALVAPVHLPPGVLLEEARKKGVPVFTHHRIAGMIAKETGRLRGIRSVEITGTYGKTTTAFALAGILAAAGERVLLHTSHGLFFDGRPSGKKLSVTPASLLAALDAARYAGLRPTVLIAEVSLGGCGTADVGVITTLKDDYPIAGGAARSSVAKMQMIEYAPAGSTIVHDATYTAVTEVRQVTFGPGGDVYYQKNGLIESRLNPGIQINPQPGADLDQAAYAEPILCAVAAAMALGAKPDAINTGLEGFDGVPGRMKYGSLDGRVLLDNSSSGLTAARALQALAAGKRHAGRRVLVLGEEKYNVCEGLDPEQVLTIAAGACADSIVLVGERLRTAGAGKGYLYAPDLEGGLAAALSRTAPGDLIISCVKTWR